MPLHYTLHSRRVAHGSRTTPTVGPTFARKTRARALKTYADALSACTRSTCGMNWKDQPLSGRGARVKRRQPAPSARAARRPQTDSTSGAAKQAAPRRICCTEMALSPPKIGSTASDPTCTRNTSSTSRSQMCARECTHPLRAIVRAGVQGWVLEQGEGSHNRGQQLVVHGDARRTVDSTYSRCCSSAANRQKPTGRPHQCRICAGR